MCSTGDAIVAGLQVLVAMQEAGQSLRELAAGLIKAPQVLLSVVVDTPGAVSVHPDLVGATRAHELAMGERGRILVRASGTEPLLRIMVEGEDQGEVTRVAEDLAEHAKGIQNA